MHRWMGGTRNTILRQRRSTAAGVRRESRQLYAGDAAASQQLSMLRAKLSRGSIGSHASRALVDEGSPLAGHSTRRRYSQSKGKRGPRSLDLQQLTAVAQESRDHVYALRSAVPRPAVALKGSNDDKDNDDYDENNTNTKRGAPRRPCRQHAQHPERHADEAEGFEFGGAVPDDDPDDDEQARPELAASTSRIAGHGVGFRLRHRSRSPSPDPDLNRMLEMSRGEQLAHPPAPHQNADDAPITLHDDDQGVGFRLTPARPAVSLSESEQLVPTPRQWTRPPGLFHLQPTRDGSPGKQVQGIDHFQVPDPPRKNAFLLPMTPPATSKIASPARRLLRPRRNVWTQGMQTSLDTLADQRTVKTVDAATQTLVRGTYRMLDAVRVAQAVSLSTRGRAAVLAALDAADDPDFAF